MEIVLNDNDFMTYKEKPLVRCGDTIYYGSMAEKYVIKLEIQTKKKLKSGFEVADKIAVSLMHTDPNVRPNKQVIKSAERSGLYNAVDLGEVWLKKALGLKG